ncbi:unannotated protein [freshwater metagenome]|uniref:Unannotated protein n=1 Tax=freshwater metagenome TaxID=449393 RepID=A0A6J7VV70_9ZZZZ
MRVVSIGIYDAISPCQWHGTRWIGKFGLTQMVTVLLGAGFVSKKFANQP